MGIDSADFRARIFAKLDRMLTDTAGTLTRTELEEFEIDGMRLPLIDGQQAIHNPQEPLSLDATLSVYSKPGSKYDDGDSSEGIWMYGYTGSTPGGRNKKLRRARDLQLPIIYYDWIAPGVYAPLYPVYVVDDNPAGLFFMLAWDQVAGLQQGGGSGPVEASFREALVRQRVHQREFRARVLHAYESLCAICGLPFASLLDAAHIRPYGEPGSGAREVPNGLALCTIHHRAYDRKLLGIDGERRLYVRPEIERISDGPVLASSLQALPGTRMEFVPKGRFAPDPDRLELTFKEYLDSIPI